MNQATDAQHNPTRDADVQASVELGGKMSALFEGQRTDHVLAALFGMLGFTLFTSCNLETIRAGAMTCLELADGLANELTKLQKEAAASAAKGELTCRH